ncbi:MAG: hypothetical protein CME85_11770 [Henriciella sp.]|nr:hypothetical protein [Henriciella sp.]MBF32777.1 hypothetical protein [Hyphomonadaceae bacterium]MBK76155.1 hypothetical protein [Henriciella sp.]PHR80627.1 MAG: hypothetical protein COA64_03560 [Henriciella sp.]
MASSDDPGPGLPRSQGERNLPMRLTARLVLLASSLAVSGCISSSLEDFSDAERTGEVTIAFRK